MVTVMMMKKLMRMTKLMLLQTMTVVMAEARPLDLLLVMVIRDLEVEEAMGMMWMMAVDRVEVEIGMLAADTVEA